MELGFSMYYESKDSHHFSATVASQDKRMSLLFTQYRNNTIVCYKLIYIPAYYVFEYLSNWFENSRKYTSSPCIISQSQYLQWFILVVVYIFVCDCLLDIQVYKSYWTKLDLSPARKLFKYLVTVHAYSRVDILLRFKMTFLIESFLHNSLSGFILSCKKSYTPITTILSIAKKKKANSFFSVVIHTCFRPLFRIESLQKYIRCAPSLI